MKTRIIVIPIIIAILFLGISLNIQQAFAQDIYESPHLRVVFELEDFYKEFVYGDNFLVEGYVEENHGLTKVGNAVITIFLEWPNSTKSILIETSADDVGDFSVPIHISTDFVVGKYNLYAEPSALGYQAQLENDKKTIEFFVVKEKQGLLKSPLKQIKNGIPWYEITCNEDKVIVLKTTNHPACVNFDSAIKLYKRGWATNMENGVWNEWANNTVREYFDSKIAPMYNVKESSIKVSAIASRDSLPPHLTVELQFTSIDLQEQMKDHLFWFGVSQGDNINNIFEIGKDGQKNEIRIER